MHNLLSLAVMNIMTAAVVLRRRPTRISGAALVVM